MRRAVAILGAIVLAVGVLCTTGPTVTSAGAAGTDDYPYQTATNCASLFGIYSWCVDENSNGSFANGEQYSPYGFAYRNCTDFVAWRLNRDNGSGFSNSYKGSLWGNANHWDTAAMAAGIPIDDNPAVGAVAQTDAGGFGHVAWVKSVNSNGTVTVEEYNYAGTGRYSQRSASNSTFRYIHVKDLGGTVQTRIPSALRQFAKPPAPDGWSDYNISSGTLAGGAGTVLWGTTVNVFGISAAGELTQWSKPPAPAGWSVYRLSPAGQFAGGASAIKVGSTIQVFATGTDGKLWQFVKEPNPAPWTRFDISNGTRIMGKPQVIWGTTVNVFAAGVDGTLKQFSKPPAPAGWSVYTIFTPGLLGGGVGGRLVNSTIQLFASSSDGRLLQIVKEPDPGVWNWYDISAGHHVKGAPSVVWGTTVNVFAVTIDGRLGQWSKPPSPAGWSFYSLSPPSLVTHGTSSILVGGTTVQVFAS